MNTKQLKFYQLFSKLAKVELLTDEKNFMKCFKSILELDFLYGVEVWEYLILDNEPSLTTPKNAIILSDTVLQLLLDKAQIKTVKAIVDSPAIMRCLYQYNPNACINNTLNILVDLIVSGKTTEAEEILKCLVKNTVSKKTYGELMKDLLERIFIEVLKKDKGVSKKIELSKKQSSLLITYVNKIKTEEKAMLYQRIRETL